MNEIEKLTSILLEKKIASNLTEFNAFEHVYKYDLSKPPKVEGVL